VQSASNQIEEAGVEVWATSRGRGPFSARLRPVVKLCEKAPLEVKGCQKALLAVVHSPREASLVKLAPEVRDAFRAFGRIGGKKGGPKGGKSRMASLTPKERSKLAKKAATARWKRK
jgi:hypothetical protein